MEQQNLNSFLWALAPHIFMLKTIILIIFDTKPFPLPEEWVLSNSMAEVFIWLLWCLNKSLMGLVSYMHQPARGDQG